MAVTLTISTVDRLNKPTSTSHGIAAAALTADIEALTDAWDAILRGAATKAVKKEATEEVAGSAEPPTDNDAERLNKWLYRVQDTVTGQVYSHEIGTADNSVLPSSTTDFLNLATGVGAALKTALEDVYESKNGNPGVLLTVQQVSRSGSA